MAGNEPIYYWDSCLFLAWLQDETRKSGEMDGVREVIDRSKRREVKIVTSVVTLVEVLNGKMPVGMGRLFADMMKRRVNRIAMDIRVAQLAHDLRDYYSSRPKEFEGKTISTPDAIHLATAIIYRVTEFHTFDGGNSKSLGLLQLSGDVAGNRLNICKPETKRPQFDLRKPTSPTTRAIQSLPRGRPRD